MVVMSDLGEPISYVVLELGTPVLSSDGEKLGSVAEIRSDMNADIFDGLIVRRGLLAGDHFFVPASRIEDIYERGVVLALEASAAGSLPERP